MPQKGRIAFGNMEAVMFGRPAAEAVAGGGPAATMPSACF